MSGVDIRSVSDYNVFTELMTQIEIWTEPDGLMQCSVSRY